jgi:hypothetical protein
MSMDDARALELMANGVPSLRFLIACQDAIDVLRAVLDYIPHHHVILHVDGMQLWLWLWLWLIYLSLVSLPIYLWSLSLFFISFFLHMQFAWTHSLSHSFLSFALFPFVRIHSRIVGTWGLTFETEQVFIFGVYLTIDHRTLRASWHCLRGVPIDKMRACCACDRRVLSVHDCRYTSYPYIYPRNLSSIYVHSRPPREARVPATCIRFSAPQNLRVLSVGL